MRQFAFVHQGLLSTIYFGHEIYPYIRIRQSNSRGSETASTYRD